MRVALVVALVALVSSLSTGAASSATAPPNLRVRVVAPVVCSGDMPCDPPVRTSILALSRVGAAPIRVVVHGPGTIWLHVHTGLYSVRLGSSASSLPSRVAAVRVSNAGVTTLRIVLPA